MFNILHKISKIPRVAFSDNLEDLKPTSDTKPMLYESNIKFVSMVLSQIVPTYIYNDHLNSQV